MNMNKTKVIISNSNSNIAMKSNTKIMTFLKKKLNFKMMNQLFIHNIMRIKMNLTMIILNWLMICRHQKDHSIMMKKESTTMSKMRLTHKKNKKVIFLTVMEKEKVSTMKLGMAVGVKKTIDIQGAYMNMEKRIWTLISNLSNLRNGIWMIL